MNHVPDKYLIVYYSASGNTKRVAELIASKLEIEEKEFDLLSLQSQSDFTKINIEDYNCVFIGSPTYGNGKTPKIVLDYLRYLLKYNDFKLPKFSVFGTGDTQWPTYCRAVDEIKYHLSKRTKILCDLKIEQYPISKFQIKDINNFVEFTLREAVKC